MANTYVALAKNVLTSTTGTVTFSSIPQTYTDLLLVVSCRSTDTSNAYDPVMIQFNSLTSGNSYTEIIGYIAGNLSTRNQYGGTKNLLGFTSSATTTANTFGSLESYMPNYAGASNKIVSSNAVSENNATTSEAAYAAAIAGLLSNTDAISSITLNCYNGSFVSGSRFDLYGIKSS